MWRCGEGMRVLKNAESIPKQKLLFIDRKESMWFFVIQKSVLTNAE